MGYGLPGSRPRGPGRWTPHELGRPRLRAASGRSRPGPSPARVGCGGGGAPWGPGSPGPPPPRLFTSPLGSTSPPHLRPGPHAPFSPGPSSRWQGARCGWSWRCLELGGRCLHRRPRALPLPGPFSSRRDAGVVGAPEALLLRRVRTMGRFEEQKSRRYGGVGHSDQS